MGVKKKRSALASALLGAVIAGTLAAPPARAGISFVDMFRNDTYTQTGNGNTLTFSGSFLSMRLNTSGPNDYTSVQATYPGPGSPVSLTSAGPTLFQYASPLYPNQAALKADFPTGTYTFAGTNAAGTDTTSFQYSTDAFPLTTPFLTGTDYTDLQGMNAGEAFTFHFSPFTPDPTAAESFLFFTIFDSSTGSLVYDAGFRPFTTTSLTLGANTLHAGTQYSYQLIYSDRTFVPSPGADFDAQLGFDRRTSGIFTTAAVPEPTSFVITGTGAGLLGCACTRRRRTAAP